MRFKNFMLLENADVNAKIIKRDCAPFLKKIGEPTKNVLWRGANNVKQKAEKVEENLYMKHTRSDRAPRDTPGALHDAVDEYFKKKYGIYFRSESVVCSTSSSVASSYGPVFVVLPIGNFDSLFSASIADFTEDLGHAIYTVTGIQHSEDYMKSRKKEELFDLLDEEFKFSFNTGLNKLNVLPSGFQYSIEVMIKCEKYYLLPANTSDEYDMAMKTLERVK